MLRSLAALSLFVALALPGATATSRSVPADALTCPGALTLEELVTCIIQQMPLEGSEGFRVPDAGVQADWRGVVREMLEGRCDGIQLPASLQIAYVVRTFTDADDARGYCVLMEVFDETGSGYVSRGWGTFIINATATRELNLQISHPIADAATEDEGIGVFKGTQARSFLMAGTHRRANRAASLCQGSAGYLEADVAHNLANLFQPAVQEVAAYYAARGTDFTGIQFHGHVVTTCPGIDVYLTYGMNVKPALGDSLVTLQRNLQAQHPTWEIAVPDPDNPPCSLHGSLNVQGRLLNGVPPDLCCTQAASAYSGRFIHIEQKSGFRDAADWVPAINDTWPAAP